MLPYSSAIRFRRALIFSFEDFLHTYSEDDKPQADFSYITGTPEPVGPYSYRKRTIINDISMSPEEIFSSYNDSTRNYINHVVKNDLCIHEFVAEPTESDLTRLQVYSNEFAARMGIPAVNMNYLRALNKAKRLNMSYVYDKNKVMLIGHGYRLSRIRPELAYSIRTFEPDVSKERMKMLSKANRYSHYKDMLQLKSMGFDSYDFGGLSDGLSDNEKWNHIDEFKTYFGGSVRVYYNSILYNTIKSKTYLKLRGAPAL